MAVSSTSVSAQSSETHDIGPVPKPRGSHPKITDTTGNGRQRRLCNIVHALSRLVGQRAIFTYDTVKTHMQALGSCPAYIILLGAGPAPADDFSDSQVSPSCPIKSVGVHQAAKSILKTKVPLGLDPRNGAIVLGAGPARADYFSDSQVSWKNPLLNLGAYVHVLCALASADVATTASIRQPNGGDQSSEDGDGQFPDHESNDPAPTSPDVAEEASRNPSGEGERPPVPPGNSGDGERHPTRDVEGLVPLQVQPADEERWRNLFTLATTCLVTSGGVGIASPSIQFTTNKHLSGNVSLLLSSAGISTVVGFSLSLGGCILLQRSRRRRFAQVSRVLTGAGCVFTTCGFLLLMGTQLPGGVCCIILLTVIPFLFKIPG